MDIYETINPSFNDMTLEQQIEHGINDWAIETQAGQVYFAQTATDARLLAELIKTGVGH
jgi:hypothetical protein